MPIPAPSPNVAPKTTKLKTAKKIIIIVKTMLSISVATKSNPKPFVGIRLSYFHDIIICTALI